MNLNSHKGTASIGLKGKTREKQEGDKFITVPNSDGDEWAPCCPLIGKTQIRNTARSNIQRSTHRWSAMGPPMHVSLHYVLISAFPIASFFISGSMHAVGPFPSFQFQFASPVSAIIKHSFAKFLLLLIFGLNILVTRFSRHRVVTFTRASR